MVGCFIFITTTTAAKTIIINSNGEIPRHGGIKNE
jgi:hypothetical protein